MIKEKLKYSIVLFLAFASLFSIQAQEQKKRILIVPFNRFGFQSAINLEDIAYYNCWESGRLVFENYKDFLVKNLSQSNDKLQLFELPENEQKQLDRKLPKVYKEEPATHFGVDVTPIVESGELKSLLQNFAADYIMFLNRYAIETRTIATRTAFEGSTFLAWSVHKLTYEVYDREGDIVIMADALPLKSTYPNQENYKTEGTILVNMEKAYTEILEDITRKLKIHQKIRKPVFRAD